MRYLIILLCAGCVASGPADVVDIKGYFCYISEDDYDYMYDGDTASGRFSFLIDSGSVSLYKRNDTSGWDLYGSSTYTDEGYYIFEDIDTGRDPGDLCTNSAWFKMAFNATGHLPEDWGYPKIQARFSHNVARPSGVPDSGSIRVDCVLFDTDYVVHDGTSAGITNLQGHWVTESNDTLLSIDSGTGWGFCPLGQDTIDVGSCLVGHFNNQQGLREWEDEDDYAEYELWPEGGNSSDAMVWGYHYWTLPWPYWGMHTIGEASDVYIVLDFVYLEP